MTRARTPTRIQSEPIECGAVALGIVMAYYGSWVTVDALRVDCGVSRDGSRALNIAKAARKYGLDARGVRMEPSDVATVKLPLIAHWEFNHFVVVEGYGPRGVYLNDPALGPRVVSHDEFDRSFTGVAIVLEPTDAFTTEGSAPSVLRSLRARLTGTSGPLVLCLLAGLGLLVPGLLVPAAVRIFVDRYLVAGDTHWLWLVVVGVSLAAVAVIALTWLQQITLLRLSTRLSMSMSARFFRHVLRLPMAYFGQRHAGNIVTRVDANDVIASVLSSEITACLLALLTSAFYLVLMAIYDWPLTLVAVAFAAGNLVALAVGMRDRRDTARRLSVHMTKATTAAVGGLQNIETLKATSEDGAFFARWAGEQAKVVSASQTLGTRTALLSSLPPLLAGLNLAVLLGFGGWQVMTGAISLGTLAAFQLLAVGFTAPLGRLVGFRQSIEEVAGRLISIDRVMALPADPETQKRRTNGRGRRLSGALELDEVTFGYSALEPPLIEGLSLRLEPGHRIAIVGPSGSGKSTVARLVAGLNRPWSGSIALDGVARERIAPGVLAASLAFVDQDVELFEATVRDNVTLWDPTIADESVHRAARDAVIHHDIVRRAGGYDRQVEEAGRDWSGGQQQRLEIARALVRDPALLVLDEATSALDPLVEHQIDQNLRARGCACLIVAHRLSTIRDCDEIVVLDHGRVAERGTHDELVRTGGLYVDLVSH